MSQRYGLLDNLQIGTQVVPALLGAANLQAKVTAIQTKRLDVAVDGGIYFVDLGRFAGPLGFEGGFDATVTAPRLGFRASWMISRRLSLHVGSGGYFVAARGQVGASDLATVVARLSGASIEDKLHEVIGDGSDVFAKVNLVLPQTRLSVDYRFNRRDSLILSTNAFPALTGQLNAGAETTVSGSGVSVEGGAYVRVRTPLPGTLASLTTLSWQFDWRRANLRLGIPLNPTNPLAWTQAVDFNLMFGKSRSKRARTWAEDDDTAQVDDG